MTRPATPHQNSDHGVKVALPPSAPSARVEVAEDQPEHRQQRRSSDSTPVAMRPL